jgi:hypothetical protein
LHALEVPAAGLWKLAGIDGAIHWCRWPIFFFRQFFLHVNTPSVYQRFTQRLKPLPNSAMADRGMCLKFQFDGTGFVCYVIMTGGQLADEERGSVREVMKSANIP